MMAVLDTNLRRVPPLHPRQVVRELPAIVLLVAEPLPLLSDVRVRRVAGEIHHWRSGSVVDETALVGAPQQLRPADTGRKGVSAHEPAVPGNRGVVQQVVANDPVELLVGVMRGDALVEPLSVVSVVLLR